MEISVFVESQQGGGYRATCLTLPGFVAEAATRDEALAQLRQLIGERYAHGEIAKMEMQLPGEPHPWLAIAGTWKDRPDLAEFEENIREYRRQVDADPDRP